MKPEIHVSYLHNAKSCIKSVDCIHRVQKKSWHQWGQVLADAMAINLRKLHSFQIIVRTTTISFSTNTVTTTRAYTANTTSPDTSTRTTITNSTSTTPSQVIIVNVVSIYWKSQMIAKVIANGYRCKWYEEMFYWLTRFIILHIFTWEHLPTETRVWEMTATKRSRISIYIS